MLDWFLLAIVAYICMAFSQVADKVFLGLVFRESTAYAAFVGVFGGLLLLAAPWTGRPSPIVALLALVAGALFIAALLPFLRALQADEATRIIPLTGAIVPLATVALERVFLGARLSGYAYTGIACLVLGAVLLTYSRRHRKRKSAQAAVMAVGAALIFAASFAMSKFVYAQAGFLTGFVWMRLGGLVFAVAVIATHAPVRADIARIWRRFRGKVIAAYAANQAVAGAGFVLQGYAIHLASAAVVTAMQGVQYVFIIFFVLAMSRRGSALVSEPISREVIIEKITATACLIAGLALLAI